MAVVLKIRKRDIGSAGYRRSGGDDSYLRPQYALKTPPCKDKCPSGNDIRGFLTTIAQSEKFGRTNEESYEQAWRLLTETNPLPAVLGRVCPHFCEGGCNRQGKDEAVSINQVERFIGDYGVKNGLKHQKLTDEVKSDKVAIVGSGPAGLSAAFQLARRGYPVTIFEAFGQTGGMLRWGIPTYRLPDDILDAEINAIKDLGVEIKLGTKIGKDISLDALKNEYKAVYLAIGAHKGWGLGIPGEEGDGVVNAVDFLRIVNGGGHIEVGQKVLVIGGGNSAIDAARVSWRLGATPQIIYRRTRDEMPANLEEIEDTEAEGIHIEYLAAPVEVVRDGSGNVTGLKCIRMELGEPDASGRRRPVPVEGSEFVIEADMIIPAIGQGPDFEGLESFDDSGWIAAEAHGETNTPGIFAGGDVTNHLGTVTEAIGLGRKAADAIEAYIQGIDLPKEYPPPVVKNTEMAMNYYTAIERTGKSHIAVDQRKNFTEVAQTMSPEDLATETSRCLSCGVCFDCGNCYNFCSYSAVKKLPKDEYHDGQRYEFKLDFCVGCKKCAEECPCHYIDMT